MKSEDYAYLYALEEDFWWFSGMRDITASLLDPVCARECDRLILDAGCGTGGNLSWLARYAEKGKVVPEQGNFVELSHSDGPRRLHCFGLGAFAGAG